VKKKQLFLDSYFDFNAIFPMEYFEIHLRETANGFWIVYYANDHHETSYGPYPEEELLERLKLAPFFFEEIVFVYHLIESKDADLHQLGVRLLKKLI
jgi:hypothetical protein